MIAKITRGTRAGDIAAYLHGPGKTAMHTYRDRDARIAQIYEGTNGIQAIDLMRAEGQRLHSRKLRAFDEPPFR